MLNEYHAKQCRTLGSKSDAPTVEFARCFLRLANLPNFALDRLSRYEATLWRQAGRIFLRSMLWIAANPRKEENVLHSQRPRTWFKRLS